MPLPLLAIAGAEAGIGAVQAIGGILGATSAQRKLDALLAQRKAYQTPQEIYDIVNATENRASNGFDAGSLGYLTDQTDRAFDSSLGAIQRLGGDPNDASALFDQKMQQVLKIAGENHRLGLETFSRFLGAKEMLASNLAAEQKSKEDILKDRLAAATGNLNTQKQNIQNGLNTVFSAASSYATGDLYNSQTNPTTLAPSQYWLNNFGKETYQGTQYPLS
jgi:hypothetical protein